MQAQDQIILLHTIRSSNGIKNNSHRYRMAHIFDDDDHVIGFKKDSDGKQSSPQVARDPWCSLGDGSWAGGWEMSLAGLEGLALLFSV